MFNSAALLATSARTPLHGHFVWLSPEKLTGTAKVEALAMLEHTSSDVASTIREHIVDCRVNNSRPVATTDPSLLQPVG